MVTTATPSGGVLYGIVVLAFRWATPQSEISAVVNGVLWRGPSPLPELVTTPGVTTPGVLRVRSQCFSQDYQDGQSAATTYFIAPIPIPILSPLADGVYTHAITVIGVCNCPWYLTHQ